MAKTTTNTKEKTETIVENKNTNAVQILPDQKMADLSKKTLSELLELRNATIVLSDYYDNYARANTGNYNYDTAPIYEMAKKLSEKYNRCLGEIMNNIQKKIDNELFV